MTPRTRAGRTTGGRRAQTTLDFAVGMGVFLLTVVFVISFAPTMFDPFAGGTGTKLVVADRAATTLSGDLLASSTAEPSVLSAGCVAGVFDSDQTRVDSSCRADIEDVDDLDRMLSLDGRNANVTIHDLGEPASNRTELEFDGQDIELQRETGGSVPNDAAVATRTVSIDGDRYRLTVRVW